MTDHPQPLGVREFAGVQFHYRIGSIDEHVLDEQYAAPRFFATGYQPRETDVIVDAGAHIGPFTVLAAPLVPRGAVHALEPALENFKILQANIASNGIDNVHAHRLALSATSGTSRLYHAPQSWGHTLGGTWAASGAPYEEVPTQTLEDFLKKQKIESIDYLKMNIEGAEYEILLRAPAAVLHRIKHMLVELHPVEDSVAQELLDRLAGEGFATNVTWSNDLAVKGWLTAHRRGG